MKSQIDELMRQSGIEALLVLGPARHNAPMTYLTGLGHISDGFLVRPRGREPVLYCFPMEREEAARTGLEVHVLDWAGVHQAAKGDTVEMLALHCRHALDEQGVEGRVGVYGRMDAGQVLGGLRRVEQLLPRVSFVSESNSSSVLLRARVTKGADEVDRIRRMGRITTEVTTEGLDFLTSQSSANGHLVTKSGEPVTVGAVKRMINRLLVERGAENPEGTIFSVGRDSAIPHSAGMDDDVVPLGKPVLLDLFPCEAGGGYYYDFTRTWCLGHAPDAVAALHELVRTAYREALAGIRLGVTAASVQARVCDLFEGAGHPTSRSDPGTLIGYVHSLGHGLGLDVHEPPAFRHSIDGEVPLEAGMVFAIEPGLYYPEQDMGVRLEDTVWIRPDGRAEVLVDFPTDLVLPVQGR
jgi:Xaa-Pro aminopeptidase